MADKTYSLIIEGFKAAGDMGAANGPPKQPGVAGPSGSSGDDGNTSGASDTKFATMAEKGIKLQEKQPKFLATLTKKMGINVGISSILKQSQIFTGTVGSIFQIFGALVDVILAPFLPIIVPVIRLLGRVIPIINKMIKGIINWYDTNLSPMITKIGQRIGRWISDHLLGWLPQNIQDAIRKWFETADWGKWAKNLILGAILVGALSRFGFGKLLGPMMKNTAALTGMAKLFPKLGAGGKALTTGGGTAQATRIATKTTAATARTTAARARAAQGAAARSKGGGGLFGGLKKALSPKNIMAKAIKAGPLGIVKGIAKKAIPGLSSALLMYQGIKGSIQVFKANMESGEGFFKSMGKASAVAGTALAGSALSFVPGMGLVAPIAGSMATDYLTKKMMPSAPGAEGKGDVTLNLHVDGEQGQLNVLKQNQAKQMQESYAKGFSVGGSFERDK